MKQTHLNQFVKIKGITMISGSSVQTKSLVPVISLVFWPQVVLNYCIKHEFTVLLLSIISLLAYITGKMTSVNRQHLQVTEDKPRLTT